MMGAPSSIVIHQLIHGYRDGHELLGASIGLPTPSRRALLALSDLSGDGSPRGFEEYLTAYPLEDVEMYAFARTWCAREMSRPGCVWTHTLLISFKDLGSLSAAGPLREYFRRPEAGRIPSTLPPIQHQDEGPYAQKVRVDGASYEIISRLYGQELPVLIFSENAGQYEETFIQVWFQQWDLLRRSFAFCTGALEPRFIEKKAFDLQVVPQQRQRRTLRIADKFSVIAETDILRSAGLAAHITDALAQLSPLEEQVLRWRIGSEERTPGDLWRDIIVQDLAQENPALHKFVHSYCGDVPVQRAAYRDLVASWALVESVDSVGISLRDLTSAIARAFPSAAQAAKLKSAILGQASIVRGAREADLVHELLTLTTASAFDFEALAVASRAHGLFHEGDHWRANAIAWLLTTTDLNEIGRQWSASVLESLTVEDVCGVFAEDVNLFMQLLQARPALATQERLWRQPRELQKATVTALCSLVPGGWRQDVIAALVRANAANLVSSLVQGFGASVICEVLSGLDQAHREGRDLDDWQWSAHLRGHDTQLLGWLDTVEAAEGWTLALVVALLGVNSDTLANTSSATFARHLSQSAGLDESSEGIDYAAYCLTLGLRNYNGDAANLSVAAFPLVHKAALRSQISRRAWQWLGPNLPRPRWLSLDNWDDGEKLRRGLIEAFLRYGWEPPLLRGAAQDGQTRRWLIRYCESFERGQALLRQAGLA